LMPLWLRTQLSDRCLENFRATLKFVDGHELAGAVRFTNVTRPDYD